MIIKIKQHEHNLAMYELWSIVDGNTYYLMAIVHEDALDKDVKPALEEKTIRVEMHVIG